MSDPGWKEAADGLQTQVTNTYIIGGGILAAVLAFFSGWNLFNMKKLDEHSDKDDKVHQELTEKIDAGREHRARDDNERERRLSEFMTRADFTAEVLRVHQRVDALRDHIDRKVDDLRDALIQAIATRPPAKGN